MAIKLKRAYDEVAPDDGVRVLVDRLWPRGISKDNLHVEHWLKDITPSTELRKWFNHDPSKFAAFSEKYQVELHSTDTQKQQLALLRKLSSVHHHNVTLVYAAKDTKHNQAVVLKKLLENE